MNLDCDDLIAAPASAAGAAARSIIRVSGSGCAAAILPVFRPDDLATWTSGRQAWRFEGHVQWQSVYSHRNWQLPAAAYHWPTSRSFTGQPLVELHLPGSPPLVAEMLDAIYRCGVRPARPGEFTLRAFLAGRIDLVQAEAVLGVIDAADPEELNTALQQLAGGLSTRLAQIRGQLLSLLADLEAGLDFVEEDIEFVSRESVLRQSTAAAAELEALRQDAMHRWRGTDRPRVVLAGLPNAGKSALFNALAQSNRALVSPVAGTTRDWLTVETTVGLVPIDLIDTAGWEAATDELSTAMQRVRNDQIRRADLILWCSESGTSRCRSELDEARFAELATTHETRLMRIVTKADLNRTGANEPELNDPESNENAALVQVSVYNETGLSQLAGVLADRLIAETSGGRHMLGSTAARARESLSLAIEALARLLTAGSLGFGDEVIAAELRAALDGLAAILGELYTDDILDVIFSRFCIGK